MRSFTVSASILSLVLLFAVPARADLCANVPGNLIQNCGFETGDFTGWVNDWAGNSVETTTINGISAYEGSAWARLESNDIYQTVQDTSGITYELSFELANSNPLNDSNIFAVNDCRFTGKSGCITLNGSTLIDVASFGWTKYTFDFTGNGTDTLDFIGNYDNADGFFALDDVTMLPEQVPEPASLFLFGSGLLASGAFGFRKRKKTA